MMQCVVVDVVVVVVVVVSLWSWVRFSLHVLPHTPPPSLSLLAGSILKKLLHTGNSFKVNMLTNHRQQLLLQVIV